MVTKKAKAKAVHPRKQTSKEAPKAQISMSRARASSTTPKAAEPSADGQQWGGQQLGIMEHMGQKKEAEKEAKCITLNLTPTANGAPSSR